MMKKYSVQHKNAARYAAMAGIAPRLSHKCCERGFGMFGKKGGKKGVTGQTGRGVPVRHGHGPQFVSLHETSEHGRVEEALRRSEQFADAQRLAHVGSWEWDLATDTVTCSDELYRIYGIPAGKQWKTYRDFLARVHRDDRAEADRIIGRATKELTSFELRHRIVRPGGDVRFLLTRGRAVVGTDGRPGRMIGACQDVTELRNTEERLRRSEQRFSLAFHATPSILVITSLEDGRYMEVNEAFERALGYRRDEVIGRSALELNIWQNPEDRVTLLRELTAGKKVRNHEFCFRSKAGTILVGLYAAEIIELDEERCILSLVHDITARKRAEDNLRRNEERYRRLYKETPAMLHSIDRDGRLVNVSDLMAETLGYGRGEVIGRKITDFHTETSRSYAEQVVIPDFFRTGSCRDVPFQIVKKDGEVRDVLLSAVNERDNAGEVVGALAVMVDVTERKRAEEEIIKLNADLTARAMELESANSELEAFNYSVSHDLRRPLSAINGYCQVIREACGGKLDDQCLHYLQEIYDGSMRMNELISALLNFSRILHCELHRGPVDLSGIATIIAAELRMGEPMRRADFRITGGMMANGDADLLRVVLDNLLGNAWKYTGTREEAVVEFGTAVLDGIPAYFVRDNGAGFPMADAEMLFTPFRRLTGAEEYTGHGIGLATVERIIRRHGGRVWAEGEPGKGAAFWFTLPS